MQSPAALQVPGFGMQPGASHMYVQDAPHCAPVHEPLGPEQTGKAGPHEPDALQYSITGGQVLPGGQLEQVSPHVLPAQGPPVEH